MTQGFLPLHWAVNQDVPSVEVVRKLIKLYPVAASCASSTGFLPLHYAVNRTRYMLDSPDIPMIF